MKDKPEDPTAKPPASTEDSGFMIEEEHFLDRDQYDNTTSFQMDIEKLKAMAGSHKQDAVEAPPGQPVQMPISDEEKERIRQSLAELREIEQEEDTGGSRGLFGRLKGLFTNKT